MDGVSSGRQAITLVVVVVVAAVLYFAREVFIPFALALLLSFLLGPLVTRLRRLHLGRLPAALLSVLLAASMVVGMGTFVTLQAYDLATKLPKYKLTILKKLKGVQVPGGHALNQTLNLLRETGREISAASTAAPQTNAPAPATAVAPGPGEEAKPLPVEIREPAPRPFRYVERLVGSVVHPATSAGIVALFLIFLLIYKEDLRDRLLRLVGMGQLHITTQALDDAAHRVSRYLLMQLVVNVSYGFPIAVGLWLIGVPNALLWGVLSALLRFIPYAGAPLAASMPIALAFAVDPGWTMMLASLGLFVGVELVIAYVVEPLLYGSSTGLSPVAIILSAVFWTWLWGPVGLLLSTPLTACLVVMGRHFPQLSLFNILFGDEPVLSPEARFYQRLLARDPEATAELADTFLNEKPLIEFYQTVLLPALSLAEQDRQRGALSDQSREFICRNTRDLMADLADHEDAGLASSEAGETDQEARLTPKPLICIPARVDMDELLSAVLCQLLNRRGVRTQTFSAANLTADWVEKLKDSASTVACISTLPPSAFRHVRYRYRRLKTHFPGLRIVLHLWGAAEDLPELRRQLSLRPTDLIVTSLAEAVNQITSLAVAASEAGPQAQRAPVEPLAIA